MSSILYFKGDKPDAESSSYKMFQGLKALGKDDYTLAYYRNVVITIADGRMRAMLHQDGKEIDVTGFDLVYLRDFHGYEHERNTLALLLQQHQKKFLNSDTARFQHISKLSQYTLFALNDVAVPDSVYAHKSLIGDLAQQTFGFPFILKSILGNSGNDNFLIRDQAELEEALQTAPDKMIAQRFVANDGDYRCIVLGDQVQCVFKRTRKEGDHRNNTGQGGTAVYGDPALMPQAHKDLAVKAAALTGREVCGVDLMVNLETGQPLVLEANFNYGVAMTTPADDIAPETEVLADYFHVIAAN